MQSSSFFLLLIIINIITTSITIVVAYLNPLEESQLCITSITQSDCEKYSVLVSKQGNCPRCETGAKQCEACTHSDDCAPGLKCDQLSTFNDDDGDVDENKNQTEQLQQQKWCVYDKSTCHHLNHLPDQIQWVPDCEPNGQFAAKQCRGDKVSGRCFCFDDAGNKIFGWDWRVNEQQMTCACSRYRARLEAAGRQDVTLHCTSNGNYEELQCDRDICWCADPLTGALVEGTVIVPNTMWQALPCYNETEHGDKYLRRCESIGNAEVKMLQKFTQHGTLNAAVKTVKCDFDGSYAPSQIQETNVICSWRDGSKIGEFIGPLSSYGNMDCACARDKILFSAFGLPFRLICNGKGSYEHLQHQQTDYFCVDAFGYSVTDFKQESIDCSKYLYAEVPVQTSCS